MKKGVTGLISLFLISLVSAYADTEGTYIGNFYIDMSIIFVALGFILIFFVINLATSKMRKLPVFSNEVSRIIISLIFTIFSIYGLGKIGISFENIFVYIGVDKLIRTFLPWIFLVILVILMWKFGIGVILMILGSLFFIGGISGLFENQALGIGIGVFLIILGFILFKKFIWKLNLRTGGNQPGLNQPRRRYVDKLIQEAKKFKSWALSTPNPKFYGTWARFVNLLGGNERKICDAYGVSRNEFVDIFNRYGRP